MKKLMILSAIVLVVTGSAFARQGGADGNHGAAGAPNSSFGQSSSGTAKAGGMDGKAQSDAAHMAHKKDTDDRGQHMGDTKSQHMGDTKGKHMGDTKGKHKGEKNEMKKGGDKM